MADFLNFIDIFPTSGTSPAPQEKSYSSDGSPPSDAFANTLNNVMDDKTRHIAPREKIAADHDTTPHPTEKIAEQVPSFSLNRDAVASTPTAQTPTLIIPQQPNHAAAVALMPMTAPASSASTAASIQEQLLSLLTQSQDDVRTLLSTLQNVRAKTATTADVESVLQKLNPDVSAATLRSAAHVLVATVTSAGDATAADTTTTAELAALFHDLKKNGLIPANASFIEFHAFVKGLQQKLDHLAVQIETTAPLATTQTAITKTAAVTKTAPDSPRVKKFSELGLLQNAEQNAKAALLDKLVASQNHASAIIANSDLDHTSTLLMTRAVASDTQANTTTSTRLSEGMERLSRVLSGNNTSGRITTSSDAPNTPRTHGLLSQHTALAAQSMASQDGESGFANQMNTFLHNAPAMTTAHSAAPLSTSASSTPAQMMSMPMHTSAAEQVAIHMTKAVVGETDKIRIQLRPESLGHVDVELNMNKDGLVRAVIQADRPETLHLLQRDVAGLTKALGEAGLNTNGSSIEFNLRGGGHHGFASQQQHHQHENPYTGMNSASVSTENPSDNTPMLATLAAISAQNGLHGQNGRVNIQV